MRYNEKCSEVKNNEKKKRINKKIKTQQTKNSF